RAIVARTPDIVRGDRRALADIGAYGHQHFGLRNIAPGVGRSIDTQRYFICGSRRSHERLLRVHLKGMTSRGAALSLDGMPLQPPGMTELVGFERTVDITPDRKELVLQATDAKGNQRKIIIPVYSSPTVARRPSFAGQKYAIVIGISRFGGSK